VHVGDDLRILYKDSVGVDHYEYWDKNIEFKGNKVYQRDDLIDPSRVNPQNGLTSIENMKIGNSATGPDGKPIHIHHLIQTQDGALAEIKQTFHQKNTKIIHIFDKKVPTNIDRKEFNQWKNQYWKERAKQFEK